MDGETAVGGTFSWLDPTIVPKGRDNGTVLYGVVFTPDAESAAAYAPAQIEIPAYTQTKLKVTITAEDRVYLPGDASAAGSYQLCDADDESIAINDVVLAGGEYAFADENAGVDKTVVFSGYVLSAEDSADYVLGNTTASALATITRAEPAVTITQVPTLTYKDVLRDHTVEAQGEWKGTVVPGTMQWMFDAEHPDTVTAAGEGEYKLEFVSDDTTNYVSVIVTPAFTAGKLEIAKPEIPAQTYTGRSLQAAVVQSSYYTVSNDSYTDAGTHYVTLALTDADNTRWPDDDATATTVPFVINRARLIRTGNLTLGNITYGQKFLTGVAHTSAMGEGKVANEAVIGPVMKIDGSDITVTGNWEWIEKSGVTDAWCNAGTYELTARFTPASVSADNYEPYEELFTVTVEKSTPTITGTLQYKMQQTQSVARLSLGIADLQSDSTEAKNPNAAFAEAMGNVKGSWVWEDEKTVPTEDGKAYNIKFVPEDSTNYNQASYSATVSLSFYSSVDVSHKAGSDQSATGFLTSKAYSFYDQSGITLVTDSGSTGLTTYTVDLADNSTYKFGEMHFTSSKSGAQQVVPMGVVVIGNFAIDDDGDGCFTKKTGVNTFFLRVDTSDFPGLSGEMKGGYFTLNTREENGKVKYIQLGINRAKILPYGAVLVYYVAGVCTGETAPGLMNASYKVDDIKYTIVNGVESNSGAKNTMALSMAAPPAEMPTEPTAEVTIAPSTEPTTEPTVEAAAEVTTEPTAEITIEPASSQDVPPVQPEESDSGNE